MSDIPVAPEHLIRLKFDTVQDAKAGVVPAGRQHVDQFEDLLNHDIYQLADYDGWIDINARPGDNIIERRGKKTLRKSFKRKRPTRDPTNYYDVGCQWIKNSARRVDIDTSGVESLVPALHLYAHHSGCQEVYSSKYSLRSGKTAGDLMRAFGQ
ncbi:hypothetical protein MIR68_011555 [Amoeboaphelidium protococcarum]|nr:hypothetical protein MIR68_011555 [Amoeboaphelidium protococcarum]